jgi:hypothetical protein
MQSQGFRLDSRETLPYIKRDRLLKIRFDTIAIEWKL